MFTVCANVNENCTNLLLDGNHSEVGLCFFSGPGSDSSSSLNRLLTGKTDVAARPRVSCPSMRQLGSLSLQKGEMHSTDFR